MSRRRNLKFAKDQAATAAYLTDLPGELRLLKDWFQAGGAEDEVAPELKQFACSFLDALVDSQALIPEMDVPAPKLLGFVLTHHLRNLDSGAAWLNLGFALRLIANSEHEPLATVRRQRAIECFNRSLLKSEGARPIEIRAWAGKALTLAQLHRFEEAVRCSREALDLDRSDPNLWLLYSSALGMAGRKQEALELIDEAYRAYVMAGRPEELRHLFDAVVSPVNTPDPSSHLRQIQ